VLLVGRDANVSEYRAWRWTKLMKRLKEDFGVPAPAANGSGSAVKEGKAKGAGGNGKGMGMGRKRKAESDGSEGSNGEDGGNKKVKTEGEGVEEVVKGEEIEDGAEEA
jgi:hypothetical protein